MDHPTTPIHEQTDSNLECRNIPNRSDQVKIHRPLTGPFGSEVSSIAGGLVQPLCPPGTDQLRCLQQISLSSDGTGQSVELLRRVLLQGTVACQDSGLGRERFVV